MINTQWQGFYVTESLFAQTDQSVWAEKVILMNEWGFSEYMDWSEMLNRSIV